MSSTHSSTHYLSLLDGLRRREDLLRILIFTLVTIFVWIGFEIYLSQKQTKITEDYAKYTEPLNPNIDREVLQEIQNRRGFSSEELQNFSAPSTPVEVLAEPSPTPTPTATGIPVLVTPTPSSSSDSASIVAPVEAFSENVEEGENEEITIVE